MNLLLLEPGEGELVTLADRRARHLIDVLGVAPGARLRAGVIGGALGHAEVLEVGDDRVVIRAVLDEPAPPPSPVRLILAVPRPKVLARVVEHAAAAGVERIDLINAWRVDKSYLGSHKLDDAALALAVRRGAEQGMTTHLPALAVHPRLMAFLDAAHAAPDPTRVHLLAHARGGVDLERAHPPSEARPATLAIGPEGGWIDRELDTFTARGFAVISLGPAILRVEAAVTAALAQIGLLRRLRAPDR